MAPRDYREVETPLGRRIKCRDAAEFLRVTRWVAWLRREQARRNAIDPLVYRPLMGSAVTTGRRAAPAIKKGRPDA